MPILILVVYLFVHIIKIKIAKTTTLQGNRLGIDIAQWNKAVEEGKLNSGDLT